jgi:hypothetical protein
MFYDAATAAQEVLEQVYPRERLMVSTWADRYRVLSGKAASEPGPWRTDRTPYLREIMDALSTDSEVEEVVLWSGTQLGKSVCCNNWIGYNIDHNPGPMMLVQPTLEMAEAWSKDRLAPMVRDTPAIRGKIADAKARAAELPTLEAVGSLGSSRASGSAATLGGISTNSSLGVQLNLTESKSLALAQVGGDRGVAHGALTLSLYSTDEAVITKAVEVAEDAGVALSINLTGGVFVNQSRSCCCRRWRWWGGHGPRV